MAAMTSKFYYVCAIQYYSDQWFVSSLSSFVFCQISYSVTRVYFRKLALEASDLVLINRIEHLIKF